MARYHFYINGEPSDLDQGGQEFPDLDAALSSASRAFGEILRDERILLQVGFFTLWVTDEAGRRIAEFSARATL